MSGDAPDLTISEFSMSELVERTGVAAATIRYYLAEGLLPPPRRAAANRFLYDERHVEVVRLIRLLQERRNLPLETIGRLLPDLLPDLLGHEAGGVFHPEMWGQLLAVHFPAAAGPSAADRLLEAGLAAFCRHGYSDVSVDDVCRAAVLAKGSFYRHFSSKEELFLAAAALAGSRAAAATRLSAADAALSRTEAAELLAIELAAYLAVVLDLSSFAAQRRPGHARVLRSVFAELASAVSSILPAPAEGELTEEGVVEIALARAVHRAAADPAAVAFEARREGSGSG